VKPKYIKLTALGSNPERKFAYQWAQVLKGGGVDTFCIVLKNFFATFDSRARFLQLVVDAIKDGANWEPTTDRRRQIGAWDAALSAANRSMNMANGTKGFNLGAAPTLREVKEHFKRLFPKAKLLCDSAFRRTFEELGLPLRRDTTGRPPGSKDMYKRKRRKNSRRKRVLVGC
jgi:hypothetical protein